MKLERIALIAEIAGAVAVVLSLIYVGLEIRANTTATKFSNYHSSLAVAHEWDSWLQDPVFAENYNKALTNIDALSPSQQWQVKIYIGQGLNMWEYTYVGWSEGLIKSSVWNSWNSFFVARLKSEPLWQSRWDSVGKYYDNNFQNHVNESLEN